MVPPSGSFPQVYDAPEAGGSPGSSRQPLDSSCIGAVCALAIWTGSDLVVKSVRSAWLGRLGRATHFGLPRVTSILASLMFKQSGWLTAVRQSPLMINTGVTMFSEAVGLGLQVFTLLIVADALGTTQYGVFAGTLALAMFISPFSSGGAPFNALRRVVHKKEPLHRAAGRAWATVILGGAVFWAVLVMARPIVLPSAGKVEFACIVAAEMLGMQLIQACRFLGQSIERLYISGASTIAMALARLCAAVVYFKVLDRSDLRGWSGLYLGTSVFAALVGVMLVRRESGRDAAPILPDQGDLRYGLTMAVTGTSVSSKPTPTNGC